MDIPLELSFHNMRSSSALKAAVEEHVRKLDGLRAHLISCRVVIAMPHKNHRTGQNLPDVRIVMRVPGKELVVSHELAHAANRKTPTDAYAVLDAAFAAAQSQLKEHRRIVQGDVKYKSPPPPSAGSRASYGHLPHQHASHARGRRGGI